MMMKSDGRRPALRALLLGGLIAMIGCGASAQTSDVMVAIGPDGASPALAKLRDSLGVQSIKRLPSVGGEIWRLPTSSLPAVFAAPATASALSAVDYVGADYRTLFLPLAASADLPPAQAAALASLTAAGGLKDVKVVRLRAGDLSTKMMLNGYDKSDGLPDNASLALSLLPNLTVSATRRRLDVASPSEFRWSGDVRPGGQPAAPVSGSASFAVEGDKVLGMVNVGADVFAVRPLGGGLHAIGRVDPASFPPEHPPGTPAAGGAFVPGAAALMDMPAGASPVIAVAVAFTAPARAAILAKYNSSPEQLINLAIETTNRSFEFSNVRMRIALTGVREVALQETGDFEADVRSLVDPGDSRADEVNPWRKEQKANAVIVLVAMNQYCGMAAGILPKPSDTYAVVSATCAVDNLSFPHEFGHLMGARHDPDTDNEITPFRHGHGYRAGSQFRTIMAYAGGSCVTCPRVQAWSSPSVMWNGVPMGTDDLSHDARVLSEVAPIFAGYFQP